MKIELYDVDSRKFPKNVEYDWRCIKMVSCKNCLSFKMCLLSSEKVGICEEFKDRSKFVELPCKVGDTVYVLGTYSANIYPQKVLDIRLKEKCSYINLDMGSYDFNDFGKNVFLTKEEAEEALKNQL